MNFTKVFEDARTAGLAAGMLVDVFPMYVAGDMFGRSGPKVHKVHSGVCGFATIHIPARGKHVNAAKVAGFYKDSYIGGLRLSCFDFNQSMARKEAYCNAYVDVLRKAGIHDAYMESRMD